MAELTDQQQETLDEKRKGIQNRPSYFSSLDNAEQTIGEELEGFAILLDGETREEVIDGLLESAESNDDRDLLLQEAIDLEKEDALTVMSDYDKVLGVFFDLRNKIFETPFGNSTEVGPLIQDLQRQQAEPFENRERSFHRQQTCTVLETLLGREQGTDAQQKQRDSWEGVLSEYR